MSRMFLVSPTLIFSTFSLLFVLYIFLIQTFYPKKKPLVKTIFVFYKFKELTSHCCVRICTKIIKCETRLSYVIATNIVIEKTCALSDAVELYNIYKIYYFFYFCTRSNKLYKYIVVIEVIIVFFVQCMSFINKWII